MAELLGDLGGVTAAGGTANALTLAAKSAVTAYADGFRVTLRAVTSNSGPSTLNVNSIGAKTIRKITYEGESPLVGGEIKDPGIYEFIYCSVLNSGGGGWLIINPTNLVATKPGTIEMFGGGSVPPGYLACDGAAVSRATYSALFAAIGTNWGAGNGTTTFNVPGLVDEFVRGAGGGRAVGTKEAQSIQSHAHDAIQEPHSHSYAAFNSTGNANGGGSIIDAWAGLKAYFTSLVSPAITVSPTGGAETRPRNAAVLFIVKT